LDRSIHFRRYVVGWSSEAQLLIHYTASQRPWAATSRVPCREQH